MLVHVKEPHTKIKIEGEDPERIIELLRQNFEVSIEEADELEPIKESDWYKEIAPTITPGKVLHVYRTNARMTLDKLAEKTGISKGHLSAMENGKRTIGLKVAKKLAPTLKCDYRALL